MRKTQWECQKNCQKPEPEKEKLQKGASPWIIYDTLDSRMVENVAERNATHLSVSRGGTCQIRQEATTLGKCLVCLERTGIRAGDESKTFTVRVRKVSLSPIRMETSSPSVFTLVQFSFSSIVHHFSTSSLSSIPLSLSPLPPLLRFVTADSRPV